MICLFIERDTNNKIFDADNYIGTRIEKYNYYNEIDMLMNEMLEEKILSHYELIMNIAYEYSRLLKSLIINYLQKSLKLMLEIIVF
ncbi:hypothetical protein [Pseudobacteroides cellulosolvens]|uniref:Uncharacterized protein n=1 Tax=Pseudobacteroides cellulosolvens ATCC 35603 = DSM 2933 TaxID=398512 RepID=A0A0L6JIP9_9FIRM|nr:hypothetical protein [Pseudobacteroides cellulosolvens]KNY25711.1 hypothetical protein Bccel_0971 [Pseudobacteroides cellulosolvens ATCC 35603 = DSM 2933]